MVSGTSYSCHAVEDHVTKRITAQFVVLLCHSRHQSLPPVTETFLRGTRGISLIPCATPQIVLSTTGERDQCPGTNVPSRLRWNFPSELHSLVIARSPRRLGEKLWLVAEVVSTEVGHHSSRRCFQERGSIETSLPLRASPGVGIFFSHLHPFSGFQSSKYFSHPSVLPLEYPVITLRLNSSSNSSWLLGLKLGTALKNSHASFLAWKRCF